jgi:NAD(P)-dependent dehydrogenase (short-subunit alcohol dehydrogenase family)
MIDIGLHGRVALVTGAAYGLGRASAALFAAAGAWIAVNYRADIHSAKSLADAIRSDGGRALLAPGDIRTSEGAWTVARYVEHEWGQVDIVLHTAALLGPDELVTDPFPLLSELIPGMHARDWGRVVVVNPPGPAKRYARPLAGSRNYTTGGLSPMNHRTQSGQPLPSQKPGTRAVIYIRVARADEADSTLGGASDRADQTPTSTTTTISRLRTCQGSERRSQSSSCTRREGNRRVVGVVIRFSSAAQPLNILNALNHSTQENTLPYRDTDRGR